MKQIKLILSGALIMVLTVLGGSTGGFNGFMLSLTLALLFVWIIYCTVYVKGLTVVQVYDRVEGKTVRLIEPGLHLILFPIETTLPPINTRIVTDEGVTIGGRSADGVPIAFHWLIWYQLNPLNIPKERMAASIDQLLNDPHKVLSMLVGISLRHLIAQRPVIQMMGAEGYKTLERYFRLYLHSEADSEGFTLHRAIIEYLEVPPEMQSVLNQAAGVEAEVGAIVKAGEQYGQMANGYTNDQQDFIERMETIRAMRKGGQVINVVSPNHFPQVNGQFKGVKEHDTQLDNAPSEPLSAGNLWHTGNFPGCPSDQNK